MSRTDSHSLMERLSALSAKGTLSSRLTLATREHDAVRLPMLSKNDWNLSGIRRTVTARAASAILQDLRSQMRVAEDMIAKLGYQMRELQKLRAPQVMRDEVRSMMKEAAVVNLARPAATVLGSSPSSTLAKVLTFRPRSHRSSESR